VPNDKDARALWDAFQTYLQDQEKMVVSDFSDLVAIQGDSPRDMARFRSILATCKQTEDADLARLRLAQDAYAVAKNIPRF
jgi:hypothetical protein